MDATTTRSLLPAEGVTFQVECRTGPESEAIRHEVFVGADWQLTTPHDLELERIGVALGGSLTCVTLADCYLPATRAWLENVHRVRPADIVQRDARRWGALVPVAGCTCDQETWPTAAQAAEHLRNVRHWAKAHDTRVSQLGRTMHALGLQHTATNPVSRSATERWLAEPDATDRLWDAGVPFDLVPGICDELSPTGLLIPTHVVIAHLYAPREWAVLEQFVPHGPLVLAWAAQHRTDRDARRPGDRLAWVEAGVPLATIDRVFAGMTYELVHARAYAAETGVPLGVAAGVLGRWQESGVTPDVRDLVELHRLDPHAAVGPRCAPAQPAVARTIGLAARRGLAVTPVVAALALARTGTAPDAVAHLARTHIRTINLEAL